MNKPNAVATLTPEMQEVMCVLLQNEMATRGEPDDSTNKVLAARAVLEYVRQCGQLLGLSESDVRSLNFNFERATFEAPMPPVIPNTSERVH